MTTCHKVAGIIVPVNPSIKLPWYGLSEYLLALTESIQVNARFVKRWRREVLYPLLRVGIAESKRESARSLPPGYVRPSGMEPLDLKIDSDLSPNQAAEGDRQAKFASQFAIGSFEQGRGTYPFTRESIVILPLSRQCF